METIYRCLYSQYKAVLLHNGNLIPSVPVAHSIILKETYDNLAFILESIKYADHKWVICADLKVVALIRGPQTGYTKHMCFLCKCDSRAKDDHYNSVNGRLETTQSVHIMSFKNFWLRKKR